MDAFQQTAIETVQQATTDARRVRCEVIALPAGGGHARPQPENATAREPTPLSDSPVDLDAASGEAAQCAVLEQLGTGTLDRHSLDRMFLLACRLAESDNDFVRYRACAQLVAIGRRDLRFDDRASLTVADTASRSSGSLRRRLMALVS